MCFGGEVGMVMYVFQMLEELFVLFGIDDVYEFGVEGIVVGVFQVVDDFMQGCFFFVDVKFIGVESGVQVGICQIVVVD